MKKTTTPEISADPWGTDSEPTPNTTKPIIEDFVEKISEAATPAEPTVDPGYDMEGLMTDFPTATELQKFVFDETGIALNLKGRANKLKYQVAMATLNGVAPAAEFISKNNPYLDKNDLVPEEPMRAEPLRDPALPDPLTTQNVFHAQAPHPDPECRAMDKKVTVEFRKYIDGTISYRVLGPIEPRAVGEKIDKYGRTRPEIIKWIDPRTGEQILQRADGTGTRRGQNLRALMQSKRVNNSTFWDTWVNRSFGSLNGSVVENPWDE